MHCPTEVEAPTRMLVMGFGKLQRSSEDLNVPRRCTEDRSTRRSGLRRCTRRSRSARPPRTRTWHMAHHQDATQHDNNKKGGGKRSLRVKHLQCSAPRSTGCMTQIMVRAMATHARSRGNSATTSLMLDSENTVQTRENGRNAYRTVPERGVQKHSAYQM